MLWSRKRPHSKLPSFQHAATVTECQCVSVCITLCQCRLMPVCFYPFSLPPIRPIAFCACSKRASHITQDTLDTAESAKPNQLNQKEQLYPILVQLLLLLTSLFIYLLVHRNDNASSGSSATTQMVAADTLSFAKLQGPSWLSRR